MSPIKLIRIEEPDLAFRYEQTAQHPRDGLFLFGPMDDRQHPLQLRYGIIGPAMAIARFKAWAERARGPLPPKDASKAHHTAWPGFEAAFRCAWPEEAVAEIPVSGDALAKAIRIGDRHEAIYRAVALYEQPILRYLATEEARPAVWFVVIPEEVYRLGRPQSEVKRAAAEPDRGRTARPRAARLGADTALPNRSRSGRHAAVRQALPQSAQGEAAAASRGGTGRAGDHHRTR